MLDLVLEKDHNGFMLTLPPAERPHLATAHLAAPKVGWRPSLDWLRNPSNMTLPQLAWQGSPLIGFAMGTTAATAVASGLFFVVLQPHTPSVASDMRSELTQEIATAKAPTEFVAQAGATNMPEAAPSPSPTAASLASTAGSPTDKVYAYQLALSQGFLKKAVDLSQQTRTDQTQTQRSAILQSLDQALEAVNKAIELDAAEGAGFLIRARIYKTAAVIKPELGAKSEQDLVIARALGVDANLLGTDTSILEFLPTQQAQNLAGAPVIADAEEGKAASISGTTSGNSSSGRVTLGAGATTLAISYPGLKATESLRIDVVNRAQNTGNVLFSVVKRVDGQGFTIQASKALENNIELEWRAIHE